MLVNCPACAKPISRKAYSCPQCGHPNAHLTRQLLIASAMLAITGLGIVSWRIVKTNAEHDRSLRSTAARVERMYDESLRSGQRRQLCTYANFLVSIYVSANDSAHVNKWRANAARVCGSQIGT